MRRVKQSDDLSDTLPIDNGVKQGYVVAIIFSMTIREAKEDLTEGIYMYGTGLMGKYSTSEDLLLALRHWMSRSWSYFLQMNAYFLPIIKEVLC